MTCPQTPNPLNPGRSRSPVRRRYTVTQADITAGSVVNVATASAVYNGSPVTSNQDTVTVPAVQTPALTLDKTTTTTNYDSVGDTIGYSYKVTNSGNVPVVPPYAVADDKATVNCPQSPNPLIPGAFITCTASYTVTQADITAGSVVNVATASAVYDGNPVTSNQDTVTVPAVPPPTNGIGDYIWYDTNDNGIQDVGESGIGNVTIDLYKDGVLYDSTVSDHDGGYFFKDLPAGDYTVDVTDTNGILTGLTHKLGPQSQPDPVGPITLIAGEILPGCRLRLRQGARRIALSSAIPSGTMAMATASRTQASPAFPM